MEYLLVVDGVQENLISIMANGGTCAPVTDNANYANRQWDCRLWRCNKQLTDNVVLHV